MKHQLTPAVIYVSRLSMREEAYIYTTGRTAFKLAPYCMNFPGSRAEQSFTAFYYFTVHKDDTAKIQTILRTAKRFGE